jgi:ribosome-binding protein aMBF1 (putative translation factor)
MTFFVIKRKHMIDLSGYIRDRLKQAREDVGLSQYELADALEVRSHLSLVLNEGG